jgi:hypothetical protein
MREDENKHDHHMWE